jgi:aminoglycoside phosphotransferase family enzyme
MLDRQGEPIGLDGEDDAAALASKVSFLSRSDSYIPAPNTVNVRETHMSWVFMAGDRVYKLKRPVRFPYLDFSTLERRADACLPEMSLNRRLAPDVYLGIAPLTMTPAGYAIGGGGRIIDWLVVMRRLDESQTLEARLQAGNVSRAEVEKLANNLRQFYTHASRVTINPESYLVSLQRAAVADRQILLNPAFELNRGTIEHISNVQRHFVQQNRKVLAERVHRRLILESHGDLRPEHIWLSAPFPIIDCLEFNARLRTLDALDEVAFLHLECERLGGRWVGEALRRRLAVFLDDDPASGLFLLYRVNRALLRARLSIAHLIDPHPRTPEKWRPGLPALTSRWHERMLAGSNACYLVRLDTARDRRVSHCGAAAVSSPRTEAPPEWFRVWRAPARQEV